MERGGAWRGPFRGWPLATRAPHDLPDFRTLGDGPYSPILLEAMERAGALFVAEMLAAHLESVPADPDALVFTAGDAHRCAIRPSGSVSGSLLSERPAAGNSSSA